jgi:predicted DCC family thiol-disulfide oxidoreductase YuxK
MTAPSRRRTSSRRAATAAASAAEVLASAAGKPIVLYDGVCGLCNRGVNFMLRFDPEPGEFKLAALQSEAGRALLRFHGRDEGDLSTIVLVENGSIYVKSTAVLRIGRRLHDPVGVGAFRVLADLALLFPVTVRDVVYNWVARNRYSFFGKLDVCRLSDAGRYQSRFITDGAPQPAQ